MQTQYKLLYRYVNPITNTPITNEADYEKTEEFYHSEHALNVTSNYLEKLQSDGYNLKYKFDGEDAAEIAQSINNEADSLREQIIRNNVSNPEKSNNLYVYTGTNKYFHKKYVPEQLGYKVRDWTRVPKEQVPENPEDFSKHFVMRGGSRLGIDDAYLVCKPEYMGNYTKTHTFKLTTEDQAGQYYKNNTKYYRKHTYITNFTELINEQNWFDWINPFIDTQVLDYITDKTEIRIMPQDPTDAYYSKTDSTGETRIPVRYVEPYGGGGSWFYIFYSDREFTFPGSRTALTGTTEYKRTNTEQIRHYGPYRKDIEEIIGNNDEEMQVYYGQSIDFSPKNIVLDLIPAHYEESPENPYIIKDCYEKISLSPWMLHSVHNSLESGLTAARKVVSMVGINNVKLIKYVPISQFIKIK